ncbi:Peptidoglycan D,D-transpeptidase MrdA [Polaromonas vacuolata]|uniref:Peptidoglycan D,D-transpeptidase MrdA n=1 Tax=Polaromonas vacuolata TaxID=37448 RepID=A0A6H2HD58_9BURK|nr:chemotaxis protein CheW [Polaromonas vacuolata]QJC57723.1 Peptidoglycan D,D-transpeptidase MrdA [Polaromonas vacuolata]
MANRQALKDLQIRLAERLQLARTEGVAPSWLAVEVGANHYLFSMAQAGEIFPWVSTHPVPYTKSWFLGVANLRGGLFGVVDLESHLTGPAAVPRRAAPNKESMLVTLNASLEVNCALLVDRLAGMRNQKAFTAFAPKLPESPDYFGNRYTDHAGVVWQEIDLQLLAQQSSFLTLGA